jgi:hypothetical protein
VLVLGLLVLTACSKTLDGYSVAQSIQQDVIKQGGISLKTVTCPRNIKPEAGQSFECIGETDTSYTFIIPVKQQDDRGNLLWDVPNAKGLLNVAKLETIVQQSVESEIGSRPLIHCGGTYKAVKPGETFACAVEVKQSASKPPQTTNKKTAALKTVPMKASRPDVILVRIDPQNNVNWQRIVPGAVNPTLTAQAPDQTIPALTAKTSAEDFLNQPGAADEF